MNRKFSGAKLENQFCKEPNCKRNTCGDKSRTELKLTFKRGQIDSTEFSELTEIFPLYVFPL